MEKYIIGNWVAERVEIETSLSEETMREFDKDFKIPYDVWIVFEYIDKVGTKRFVANCGYHKNTEKNAKEIAELHNKNR